MNDMKLERNNNLSLNTVKKGTFLNMALISFLGLGMEFAVIALEVAIYGINPSDYTYSMGCMHLVYTILVWAVFTICLIKHTQKKCSYDIMKNCSKPEGKQIAIAVGLLAIMTIWQYFDWGGLKIIKEFQHNGMIKGMLQHIYYFLETSLVTLIVIFGQKYGESRFNLKMQKDKIPWGGILLAVTWGAVHMLSKDVMVGIETIVFSIVFGLTYIILKKNTKLTYVFITLMFIL